MKKIIIFMLALILLGCTNIQKSKETGYSEISEYFAPGNYQYSGGFENAGSKVMSTRVMMNEKEFIVEDTQDTAANVQRVYIVNKNSVDLIFTAEETKADLSSLNTDNGETVLKMPLKVGNEWESKGNKYKIIKVTATGETPEITVEKIYPHGMTETVTYRKGVGKVARKIKM